MVVSTCLKNISQIGSFPMVSGWKLKNIWVATTQITMRTWGAYQALFMCCAVISSSSGTTKFANSHINSDAVYPWTFPADGVFRLWFRYISNQPVLGNPRCGGFRFRNKLLICKRMQTLFLFLAACELCFGRHPCIYASNCFESQLCIANHSTLTNLLAFLYEHTGIYYGWSTNPFTNVPPREIRL